MPTSIWSDEIQAVFAQARSPRAKRVQIGGKAVEIPAPFPSPEDWRDKWIYFLLVDRFNNPQVPPKHLPWNGEHGEYQGGTFNGVRAQLGYLQDLGVGSIWLSPMLKNCQFTPYSYHGYGIQDYLQIEPRFASDPEKARKNPQFAAEELIQLVDEAHARGIYVIFDIVLNHAGDVFEYDGFGSTPPWRDYPYLIHWRDENGQGRPEWTAAPNNPPPDAAIWPAELCRNEFFRRRGEGGEEGGDFGSLKEFVTAYEEFSPVYGVYYPVRDILIRAHQYLMEDSDLIGVDAALDFSLFYKLPDVAKGQIPPTEAINMVEYRRQVEHGIISSQGEASKFFVTFLDNHDQHQRFYYSDPNDPHRCDDQVALAAGCLFTLQGIPCLYYGTEQGLHGAGWTLEAMREALWGKSNAFDRQHSFYKVIQNIAAVRRSQPALRYGRQYFRQISGDGVHFGFSNFPSGVLAFSRILSDQELIVVANTNTQSEWQGEALVDFSINPVGSIYYVLFSNKSNPTVPEPVSEKTMGSVEIHEVNSAVTYGPTRVLRLKLQPIEKQILEK